MVLREWLKEMEYRKLQGSLVKEVTEVVYDSRKACAGAVFVCIKGTRIDSHEFCDQVYEAGTRVFVVERPLALPEDATVIMVENSRKALAYLSAARFGYPDRQMVTIGVTGTKGKTTTIHMIKAILEVCQKKVGMIGTNGVYFDGKLEPTQNTTPESYQLHQQFARMAEAGCEYLVMEVSSQAFKLHRTDGIFFDFGIFTNLSPDHIGKDEHADFEEYLACKSRIFCQSRIGIANLDDEHFEAVTKHADCPIYTYSLTKEADFTAEAVRYVEEAGFVGLEFQAAGRFQGAIRAGVPGKFNVSNAMAAISVCSFLNLPKEQVCRGLAHLHINGRMELAYASETCKVIIDYAHNAVSMESLLNTLRDYQPARLVVVFGCGGNRSKDRRYSMGAIAGKMADFSIITADNSRYEKTEDILADIKGALLPTGGAFMEIPDRREAIIYAITHAEKGDMIAIIGKGHEDYQEINGVRTHFLDREVVEEAAVLLNGKNDKTGRESVWSR